MSVYRSFWKAMSATESWLPAVALFLLWDALFRLGMVSQPALSSPVALAALGVLVVGTIRAREPA
jgi:ABC-type nitrate/sulfonate/bicarbonate transport system permease component